MVNLFLNTTNILCHEINFHADRIQNLPFANGISANFVTKHIQAVRMIWLKNYISKSVPYTDVRFAPLQRKTLRVFSLTTIYLSRLQ